MIKFVELISAYCLISLMALTAGTAWSKEAANGRCYDAVTTYSYTAGADEAPTTARALALFGAKYKAVVQIADRLTEVGLLRANDNREKAVFCLVADAMASRVVKQSNDTVSHTYTATINSTLCLTDYVKAEIRNDSLERKEEHFSFKEEMEPAVSPVVSPALELSRAYRYISHGQWRMAIIYMDHLETKYPNWGVLHLAMASAYQGIHENAKALSALSSACYLGVQEACMKINALDPPD